MVAPFARLIAKLFPRPLSRSDRRRATRLRLESLEGRDVPAVSFTVEDLSNATEGGSAGQFRVTANGDSSDFTSTVTAVWGYSGSATYSTDYTTNPTFPSYLTFNSPGSTQTITVTAVDDSTIEGNETVTLTVQRYTMFPTGPQYSDSLTLVDNDPALPNVTVEKINDPVENGGIGLFRFTRSGATTQELGVAISVGGTATVDDDFVAVGSSVLFLEGSATADLHVAPVNDLSLESGGESVTVTITAGTSYTVGDGTQSTQTASLTIADDDETPMVSIIQVIDAVEGGQDGTFRLSRTGDLTESLTVTYTVGSTGPNYASPGSDYTALSGTVIFEAGAQEVDVSFTAFTDTLSEMVEYVSVILDEGTVYDVGSPGQAEAAVCEGSDAALISGRWFLDVNGNAEDDEEDGYDYSRVYLFRDGGYIAHTFTDATGGYSFGGLPPGTYDILFDTPDGITPTTSTEGWRTAIDVEPAATVEVSEGCQPPAAPAPTGVRNGIDSNTYDRASIRDAAAGGGVTGTECRVKTAAGNWIWVFNAHPAASQSERVRAAGLDIRYNCHGLSFNTRLVILADGGLREFALGHFPSVLTLLADQYNTRTDAQAKADLADGKRVISVFYSAAPASDPIHSILTTRINLMPDNTTVDKDRSICETKNGVLPQITATFTRAWNMYTVDEPVAARRAVSYTFYSPK